MTEDELQQHLLSTLIDDESPWPYEPICEGDWRLFDRSESVRILARLSAEQLARNENPIPFHSRVKRLRGTTLSLYPRYLLIEGQADLTQSSAPATFNFALGEKGVQVFNWTAADVGHLNKKVGLNLKYNVDYRKYLSLYCGIATGNDGRFRILQESDSFPWRDGTSDVQKAMLGDSLADMKLRTGKDGRCEVETTAIYGRTLYQATFAVSQIGEVEVMDREVLFQDLNVQMEAFFGPFRIYRS